MSGKVARRIKLFARAQIFRDGESRTAQQKAFAYHNLVRTYKKKWLSTPRPLRGRLAEEMNGYIFEVFGQKDHDKHQLENTGYAGAV